MDVAMGCGRKTGLLFQASLPPAQGIFQMGEDFVFFVCVFGSMSS